MNGMDQDAFYVICTLCNPGTVVEDVKASARSMDNLADPLTVVACMYCGARLTFTTALIPKGGYCPEAEACSPDGSGAAFIANHRAHPWRIVRKKVAAGIGSLEAKIDQLKQLADYAAHRRDEFADDPILLQAFDRLIDREKRKIMGNPDER